MITPEEAYAWHVSKDKDRAVESVGDKAETGTWGPGPHGLQQQSPTSG